MTEHTWIEGGDALRWTPGIESTDSRHWRLFAGGLHNYVASLWWRPGKGYYYRLMKKAPLGAHISPHLILLEGITTLEDAQAAVQMIAATNR